MNCFKFWMEQDKGQRGKQTHMQPRTCIPMPVLDCQNYRVKLAGFLSVIHRFTVQAVCIRFVSRKVTLKLVFLYRLPFHQPFIILSIYSSQPRKYEKVFIESVLVSLAQLLNRHLSGRKTRHDFLMPFCQGMLAIK